MTAFQTAADVARTKQVADWHNSALQAVNAFLSNHPNLHIGDANRTMLVQRTCEFMGIEPGEVQITVNDIEMTFDANGSYFRKALAWVKPEEQRENLINEVCALLRSPDGTGKGGRYSDADLRNERIRMSTLTIDKIIARLEEIKLKQALQPKSAQEIRQGLAEFRASQQPGRVALPPEITAQVIRRASVEQIKFWNRKHGAEAVNDRLFGRN